MASTASSDGMPPRRRARKMPRPRRDGNLSRLIRNGRAPTGAGDEIQAVLARGEQEDPLPRRSLDERAADRVFRCDVARIVQALPVAFEVGEQAPAGLTLAGLKEVEYSKSLEDSINFSSQQSDRDVVAPDSDFVVVLAPQPMGSCDEVVPGGTLAHKPPATMRSSEGLWPRRAVAA